MAMQTYKGVINSTNEVCVCKDYFPDSNDCICVYTIESKQLKIIKFDDFTPTHTKYFVLRKTVDKYIDYTVKEFHEACKWDKY